MTRTGNTTRYHDGVGADILKRKWGFIQITNICR